MRPEHSNAVAATAAGEAPAVPLTMEGSSVLHQMMRVRWSAWRGLSSAARQELLAEAVAALAEMERPGERQSALYSLLGHKGDLMFVHFRKDFEELNQVEWKLARLGLSEYLEQTSSYLSVVELGLYESTSRIYASLLEKGVAQHSPEWNAGIEEALSYQRKAMAPRLWPEIPPRKYCCFYPMDRRRGEEKNWYMLPLSERAQLTDSHGKVGRRYAGVVRQIITTSVGFDDWEWGVDLFADDPLVFKKLIYEMRFDEVSALYAMFGTFYVGLRVAAADLAQMLDV